MCSRFETHLIISIKVSVGHMLSVLGQLYPTCGTRTAVESWELVLPRKRPCSAGQGLVSFFNPSAAGQSSFINLFLFLFLFWWWWWWWWWWGMKNESLRTVNRFVILFLEAQVWNSSFYEARNCNCYHVVVEICWYQNWPTYAKGWEMLDCVHAAVCMFCLQRRKHGKDEPTEKSELSREHCEKVLCVWRIETLNDICRCLNTEIRIHTDRIVIEAAGEKVIERG